jgi:ABC-type antimicrobial peptide transport system permease subunit
MYLDATVNSGKKEINASIYGGMENCGVIWPTDLGTDKVSDCIGEISHLAEVKGVGSYNLSYIGVEKSDEIQNPASDKNYLTDILEIQNKKGKSFNDTALDEATLNSLCESVFMPKSAFNMYELTLTEGKKPDSFDEAPGTYLLYLGCNFKSIPVGAFFVNANNKYVIAGILKKGVRLPDTAAVLANGNGILMEYTTVMDNLVIEIPSDGHSGYNSVNMFACADGFSFYQTVSAVQNVIKKHGLSADITIVSERISRYAGSSKMLSDDLKTVSILVTALLCLSIVAFQIIDVMIRQKELGIYLISGVERKVLFNLLVIENVIKMVCGILISGILLFAFIKISFVNVDVSTYKYVKQQIFGMALLQTLAFSLAIAVLTALIPIYKLSRMSNIQIINSTWK